MTAELPAKEQLHQEMAAHLDNVRERFTAEYFKHTGDSYSSLMLMVSRVEGPVACLLLKQETKAGAFILTEADYAAFAAGAAPLRIKHRRCTSSIDYGEDATKLAHILLTTEEVPTIVTAEGCLATDAVNDCAFWLSGALPS